MTQPPVVECQNITYSTLKCLPQQNRLWRQTACSRQSSILADLIQTRNLFDVQKVEYELTTVNSMDIDPSKSFLLVGLCNGSIDIQEISNLNTGNLEPLTFMKLANTNLHRVQWYPGGEQFFYALDNTTLHLVDPNRLQIIDKFTFNMNAFHSDWNANNDKIIAVCGSQSQVRLVDIKSGNFAQTIILSAPSRLPTHRATRCVWSKSDTTCLIIGDNEGYLHIFDTRHSRVPLVTSSDEFLSQISGMSFTDDQNHIITSHGSNNKLVEWSFNEYKLIPNKDKFNKVKKEKLDEMSDYVKEGSSRPISGTSSKQQFQETKKKLRDKKVSNKPERKVPNIPGTSFLRCQFHITEDFLFCPVPSTVKKSKELYIYDLKSGSKLKTLKSDEILSTGVYSVVGLLPSSLVLFVGGRGRLRVWTLDEQHKLKLEEKIKKFHVDDWDSE